MGSLHGSRGARTYTRRHFIGAASLAIGGTLLVACGGSSESTSSAAASENASGASSTPATTNSTVPAGKPGGTKIYRVGLAGDLNQLDPALLNNQNDYQISETIFNYMARYSYNPPLSHSINPEVAEKWEITPDAKEYTFHLRHGVEFVKGYGELTSADVKAGWEHIKAKATGSPYRNDFIDAAIETSDPYTIKATFPHPFPAFIQSSLSFRPGLIVCAKAFAKEGEKWTANPVGSGPFMFSNYVSGTSLTAKRNPKYWGTKPKIDEIMWKMRVDDRAAVLAVSKGELDAYYIADPDVASDVLKNPPPNTRFLPSKKGQSPWMATFNLKHKPLDDIRVRHALRYAIDNEAIAKQLFSGLADPIQSFLPPFMFGYNPDVTPKFNYDPDKAKQLLKEANVPPNWNLEAMTVSELIISSKVLQAVGAYWEQVGIKVTLDIIDQGVYTQRSISGDYDVNCNYTSRIDPDQIASPDFSSTTNRNGYSNPDVDKLIIAAKSEPDPTKRAQLYHQLQDKVSQDSPAAFVVAVSEHLLLNTRVTGEWGSAWQERHDWFTVDVPAE